MSLKDLITFSFSVITILTVFAFDGLCQAARPVLIVLNKTDNDAVIIDPVKMAVIAKIPVGVGPHEVVFSGDGKTAFVANYGTGPQPGNTLSVIDIATAKEVRRVDLGPLLRPHGIQAIGAKVYFTAETSRAIARYDPAANKVDWIMGTGQNASHMIAGSQDQKKFYTANIASNSVTAFGFQNVPPAGSTITQIAVGRQPEAIDISPDAKEVWVGLNQDGGVDVIDTASNKVITRIDLGGRPYRVRFTPDGKHVVNPVWPANELAIVDAATKKITKRVKIEGTPFGITFSADSRIAFVTALQPDRVLKVDLVTGEVLGTLVTGNQPDGIAVFGF